MLIGADSPSSFYAKLVSGHLKGGFPIGPDPNVPCRCPIGSTGSGTPGCRAFLIREPAPAGDRDEVLAISSRVLSLGRYFADVCVLSNFEWNLIERGFS